MTNVYDFNLATTQSYHQAHLGLLQQKARSHRKRRKRGRRKREEGKKQTHTSRRPLLIAQHHPLYQLNIRQSSFLPHSQQLLENLIHDLLVMGQILDAMSLNPNSSSKLFERCFNRDDDRDGLGFCDRGVDADISYDGC